MAKRDRSIAAPAAPAEPLPSSEQPLETMPLGMAETPDSDASPNAGERRLRRQQPWTAEDEKGQKVKTQYHLWSRALERLELHAHKIKVKPSVLLSRLIMREIPEYELIQKKKSQSGPIDASASEENQAA